MQVILDYPFWFIGFCLLLGAVASLLLYYKSNHFTDETVNFKYFKYGMAIFRFLSVSTIAFLLLSPFIKSKFTDKIEPIVVLVHDNSSSIQLGFSNTDSASYRNNLAEMEQKIASKFQLDKYTFDNKLADNDTLNFKGKSTDISAILGELNGLYQNRNVGAVILATDGIYNEGINPVYSDFTFPIYTIALGDTAAQKDLKISAVRNNKIAYLDDKVQVEIDIEANKLKGESFKMEVFELAGGKENKITEQSFKISKPYEEFGAKIMVTANGAGMLRYRVKVSNLKDEITYDNNYREFYIDVIDSRQKILIIANAPHPDLGAIKQVTDLNKNYELKISYAQEFSENVEKYNLVILHQLPSKNVRANQIFSAVKKAKVPYWIITGASTQYANFNQEQNMVSIAQSGNSTNDASAFFNTSFNQFTLDENTILKLKRFPPIQVPFGSYNTQNGTNVLLKQRIGSVETDFPILAFSESMGVKTGVFVGDGLWRWRMYDYLDNGSHQIFNELVQKTINYLAVKADKRKFKVNMPKNVFLESEPIVIEAELYNDSYELINEPEATILLKDEEGKEFPFSFAKVNNAYALKTNSLPIGNYTYTAQTNLAGKNYTVEGSFSVNAVQLEALQTQANHALLFQLSEKTNGKFYYPNNLTILADDILNLKELKPLLYDSFKTRTALNLFWILMLILTLLSVEWFARKYFGGY